MDPIEVRERLRSAQAAMREAEFDISAVARAVNAGEADGWTEDQRATAYGLVMQEMARLRQAAGNGRALDVLDEARTRLLVLAGLA